MDDAHTCAGLSDAIRHSEEYLKRMQSDLTEVSSRKSYLEYQINKVAHHVEALKRAKELLRGQGLQFADQDAEEDVSRSKASKGHIRAPRKFSDSGEDDGA